MDGIDKNRFKTKEEATQRVAELETCIFLFMNAVKCKYQKELGVCPITDDEFKNSEPFAYNEADIQFVTDVWREMEFLVFNEKRKKQW